LLILPVAAGLGATGALLARTGPIPSAHPHWLGIITVAACAILLLGTAPLVASPSSNVPAPGEALASQSGTAPESDVPLPNFEDLPSNVEDVPKPEPPPAPEPESPAEPQGSQDTAASPEQRFISRYYAAVEREDWDATYSLLDSASKSQFTREEWARKQQARQAARNNPPIESVKIRNPSCEGDNFTATVELTHEDGTKTPLYGFEVTQERGKFRRHLTSEELVVLKNY
jgi:hypothetical protein